MAKATQGPSDRVRIAALEQAIYDLQRARGSTLAMRDLTDASLVPAGQGYVPTYDAARGVWVASPPYACVLTKAANQSIPEATGTDVALDTVVWDPFAMRSGSTIVIPESGLWSVRAAAYWAQYNTAWGVGGQRSIHVDRDRGGVSLTIIDAHVSAGSPDSIPPPNSNPSMVGPADYPGREYPLNKGDILSMEVLQQVFPGQPTGARNLVASGHAPLMSAVLVAR